MATKKDMAELKTSISQINQAIGEIWDSVIKALLKENNALKERIKSLGIAADVSGEKIEEKVIDILRKVDFVVAPRDIEAVHRLGVNGKKTIVQFLNRKNAVAALSTRAALRGTDVFIEENFCPFIAKIGYMGRKLKRKRFIFMVNPVF